MKRPDTVYSVFPPALLAFDPGLVSLRTALRGTGGVIASFFLIAALAKNFALPPALAFVGPLVAMLSALVVGDPSPRARATTSILIAIPVSLAVLVSVLLHDSRELHIAAFLGVTYLAVWSRRYGPRWIAFGFVSFMTFIMPLFFPIPPAAVGWAVASAVIGCGVAALFRLVIFRDRPEKILALSVRAFELRAEKVLANFREALNRLAAADAATEAATVTVWTERVRASTRSLNELTLMIEQLLQTGDSRALKSSAEALQMRLFERELALRRLLECARTLIARPDVPRAFWTAAAAAIERHAPLPQKGPGATAEFRATLDELLADLARPLFVRATVAEVAQAAIEQKKAPPAPPRGLHYNTRQAIQATLATALASAAGYSLSPARWYWASITAFVVFTGASRGETAARAAWRTLGTGCGLIAGFLLAWALSGHTTVEWLMIIGTVFGGLYVSRLTFGFWTASSFTAMLALLLSIQGQLTTEILALRLEETALGALLGAIIGATVLPTTTRSTVSAALGRVLSAAAEVVGALPLAPEGGDESPGRGTSGGAGKRGLVRNLRAMDQELMGLRAASAPIAGPVARFRKGTTTAAVYHASVLAHLVRHLATTSLREEDPARTRATCRALAEHLRALARADRGRSGDGARDSAPLASFPVPDPRLAPYFQRIDETLRALDRAQI